MSLTQTFIDRVSEPGRYHDRDNLYLQVRSKTNKSWLFRYNRRLPGLKQPKERYMGLGASKDWTLEEARDRARKARQLLADGIDPIDSKLAARTAKERDAEKDPPFKEAAELYIEKHKDGWRSEKHGARWASTLIIHNQLCY
jgi:hypothetical protein